MKTDDLMILAPGKLPWSSLSCRKLAINQYICEEIIASVLLLMEDQLVFLKIAQFSFLVLFVWGEMQSSLRKLTR